MRLSLKFIKKITCLLNNLESLGVGIDKYKMLVMFLDIVPMKWIPLIPVIKNNFTLDQHTLDTLYRTFIYNELKKKREL